MGKRGSCRCSEEGDRVMKDQGVYGRKGRHCTRRRQMVIKRDELGLGKLR